MKNLNRVLSLLVVLGLVTGISHSQLRYGKLGIGPVGSAYLPTLDDVAATATAAGVSSPTMGVGGGLSVIYSPWEVVALKAIVGVGQFTYQYQPTTATSKLPSTTTMATLNGYITLNLMPNSSFNPFLGGGMGYHYTDARTDKGSALVGDGSTRSDISFLVTGGFDVFFNEFISVTASADYAIMNTDWLDGRKVGSGNDSYIRAGLEVRYYFFDQAFLTRLLEALKARYEN